MLLVRKGRMLLVRKGREGCSSASMLEYVGA